jgi:hypothetical protein
MHVLLDFAVACDCMPAVCAVWFVVLRLVAVCHVAKMRQLHICWPSDGEWQYHVTLPGCST